MEPEQLKQKSRAPISQAGKIQMNTKVNKERIQNALKNKVANKNQTV